MRAHILRALALATLTALGACSLQIDEEDFAPSIDADVTDASPVGLALTPSLVNVTEGFATDIVVSATLPLDNEVTVTLGSDAALSLSTQMVVIGPSQPTATFTVTALDDDDAQSASATVNAQATGLGVATAQVDVMDNDTLELEADQTSVSMNEDIDSTVRVRLKAKPQGDLTVNVASSDIGIASVSPAQIFFSTTNWNVYQPVTVHGNHDLNAVDDTAAVNFSNILLPAFAVQATVIDTDRLAILASPGSTTVVEQGTAATINVHLSQQPTTNVTVTAGTGSAGIQVSPSTLQFTPQNYTVNQPLTITALADDDTDGFTTTVTLTANVANVTPVPVTVIVNDDDMQTILETAPNPLSLGEGATATFNARLAYRPAGNVVVNVASLDTNIATVAPGTLTFTNTNWDQNQAVTVTGIDDDNVITNSTTIRLTSGTLVTDVATDVTDPDVQALVVTGEPTTVPEGSTATFMVALAYRPQTNTTVTIASNDPAIGVQTPSLTFTSANYATPQMVVLDAPTDVDVIQETSTITISSPPIPSHSFSTMVAEASVITIQTSTSSVAVTEQAAGVPFNVTLSNPPASSLVVNIASGSPGVTVSPSSLTFTSGNYNTPQAVTVTGLIDDDVANISTNVTLTATGANMAVVAVMVTDDDVQSIIENAPDPLSMNENATATFGARLAFRPGGNTVVTVTSLATGTATVSPGSLTFTTANWDQLQTVTVTGAHDVDTVTSSTTTRLQSGTMITDVATSVTDIDTQDITLSASPPTTITEGANATFTVRLAYMPQANVAVTVGSSDGAVTVMNPNLTFTPSNYAMPQTVTLNAPTDANVINEISTITVSSAGLTSKTFNITVSDQSTITIQTSVSSVTLAEGGASGSFNVTLSNPPASNLTVNIASNNANVTRSPTSLVFTSGNYNTPQSVSLTALADNDTVGGSATITLSGTGATSATVSVTTTDPNVQAIVEDAPATVDVIDPDGSAPVGVTFNVHLAFQPQGNTTVNIASLNTAIATVSPASLTFSTSDWGTDKPVTVTAVGDVNMTGSSTTARLTSSGLSMVDIPVAVTDQDVQVVQTDVPSLTVGEGTSGTLMVRLKYQPAGTTTVTLASNNTDVTVPATLTFLTGNYNTYQNAAVAAAVDSDQINDTATITLGNSDAPSNTTVAVTVTDTTIVENYGWWTPFASAFSLTNGHGLWAQKITVTTATTLDRLGIITNAAGNDFKLAVYTDSANVPGSLVTSVATRTAATGSDQQVDIGNVALATGSYWIVARANTASVRWNQGGTAVRVCTANAGPFNIDSAWPAAFGAATCQNVEPINIYIVTFR